MCYIFGLKTGNYVTSILRGNLIILKLIKKCRQKTTAR